MEPKGVVLLIEDNEALNTANRRALALRGYAVQSALTLGAARKLLSETQPDIILLDVMLPDGDGLDFCVEIRESTEAHILFLTAKIEHEDMVRGLLGGGDDYITKPFHPEELLVRIDAAMRRRNMPAKEPTLNTITWEALRLDLLTSTAFVGKQNLLLTKKEFSLLLLLIQNRGSTLEKEELYEAVWNQPMAGDGGALWQHISRLKKKLEAYSNGTITIFTSRGQGYSLEFQ